MTASRQFIVFEVNQKSGGICTSKKLIRFCALMYDSLVMDKFGEGV